MSKFAWLTPDLATLSESPDCRVLQVPGNLWNLVSGALLLLTEPHNWEEFGTATIDETSQYFQTIFEDYLMSTCATIGEVKAFMRDDLPDGWLPFDGSQHLGADYPELYDVLPDTLKPPVPGTTFLLPDLSARSLVGAGSIAGANVPLGVRIGQSTVTLNETQIPAHTHTYNPPVPNIDLEAPGVPDILAAGVGTPIVTGSTGGGQAHSNMPPVIGVTWGIYAGI